MLSLILWTDFASAQNHDPQPYGYSMKEDSISFEFFRNQYDYVIQEDGSRKFPMDQLTIYNVTLVVNFLRNQPSTYPMIPDKDSATYRISFPLDTLAEPDWTFRFYINGYYAVEPPALAVNRIPSNTDKGYYFITLLQQNAAQPFTDRHITDQNAQKWLAEHATQMTSAKGLRVMQELLQSGKVIGIGRSEQDSLKTFPLRLALAQWLVTKMDYHLIAFQIDPLTSKQVEYYLAGDSSGIEPSAIEIINIVKWSDLRKSKGLDYKPLYMGYQKENIINSLHTLTTFAPTKNTLLQQDILQLVHEVNSLLMLQEEWGVYYYNSPSYQKYLSRLWHSINDKLRASEMYEYAPYNQLKPALEEVRSYLKHLENLKRYYKKVEKQLSKYFHWIDKPKLDVKFIVWDENHEVSSYQPGSVGRFLHDEYGDRYISVGIGSFSLNSSKEINPAVSLEIPFVQEIEQKVAGQQAFIIDLRKENLTPEEQQWLEEKVYSPTEQKTHSGKLTDEFDLVILLDEEGN